MISLKNTLEAIKSKISSHETRVTALESKGRTLLWTNPSPTRSFAAQTITLSQSLSNFDAYEILYFQSITSGGRTRILSSMSLVGYGFIISQPLTYNNFRASSGVPSGKSLTFENGTVVYTLGQATTDNSIVIPYKIYGIKF